ncbi:MAG: alpha/beta hydrolase [Frankiales bacterium]|nr:alpha/beta hydrolase [Frankiales bacterium]
MREVETARGPARVHLDVGQHGLLVLGHGAGGGPEAPDLLAAREGAVAAGFSVARVEQPWRVAGKRVAAPAAHLDEAWLAVLAQFTDEGPLVLGGRSSGARVACRTATELRANAVLALAFPLVPPGKATSRAHELAMPLVPRLVVQGSRDAFGIPASGEGVDVHPVAAADHSFAVRRQDGRTRAEVLTEVRTVVRDWLQTVT